MGTIPDNNLYGLTTKSRYSVFANLLGYAYFHPGEIDYTNYLKDKKGDLLKKCEKYMEGKAADEKEDCTSIINNGIATFCQWTENFEFCKTNSDIKVVTRPPPTTTTFSIGALIGGSIAGAFIGALLAFLIFCLWKRKRGSSPTGASYSSKTVSGATGTTGTSGTTGSSTTTGTGKTNKKKEKKAKKNKKNTTQTQTKPASAY